MTTPAIVMCWISGSVGAVLTVWALARFVQEGLKDPSVWPKWRARHSPD